MIPFDPNQTTGVSLEEHKDVPAEKRPTFVYRYMSIREHAERNRKFVAAREQTNSREQFRELCGALSIGLVDWRNVSDPAGEPVPFDVADLDRALTPFQAGELFEAAGTATLLSEVEKKRSRSAASSEPAPSAKPADSNAAA